MTSILVAATLFFADASSLLPFDTPAPGRSDGRVYYYVPAGVDTSRPAPLLVFLHDAAGAHKPDEHGSLASAAEYLDFFTKWIPQK